MIVYFVVYGDETQINSQKIHGMKILLKISHRELAYKVRRAPSKSFSVERCKSIAFARKKAKIRLLNAKMLRRKARESESKYFTFLVILLTCHRLS